MLDFADAAEILEYKEDEDVPTVLRKDKLVLVSVFTQIEKKLESLAIFTKRYEELTEENDDDEDIVIADLPMKEKYSALLKWDKAAKQRKSTKGTNHVVKFYQIGKDIIKHPKRLRWTAFDEKKFRVVVGELSELNDFLHELLDGEYSRRLEERTKQTHLELVLVRNEIQDLQHLFITTMMLNTQAEQQHDVLKLEAGSDNALAVLTDVKRRSVLIDAADQDKPPEYHELIKVDKLTYQRVTIASSDKPENGNVVTKRMRTLGTLSSLEEGGAATPVFIEWKAYNTAEGDGSEAQEPREANLERVKGLVSLLQHSKLRAFAVPRCLGFFDLRDDEKGLAMPTLFGLVYEIPGPVSDSHLPASLLQLLGSPETPSLSVRMKLAYRISNSVLYFNSIRWFHKSLRADAVIFHPDRKTGEVTLSEPLLSGFEYARPSSHTGNSTHIPENPADLLYVHELYQGANKGSGYARSFDIYSLGIILLEIAYWQPIRTILAKEFKDSEKGPMSGEARAVRKTLLKPTLSYLSNLKRMVGDRYFKAVQSCIAGLVGDDENEDDLDVCVKLHEGFVQEVVGNLKALQDL